MTSLINPTNIDGSYPIAGQDNDSQGFRDNFTNTKNNLTTAQSEISDLQGKVIVKSALANSTLDNDMAYTTITHPQLNAHSETFYVAAAAGTGTVTLDYDLGTVQQITTGASIVLGFSSWPTAGQAGKMKLWVNVTNVAHTLTLPAACNVGFPASLAGASVNLDGSVTISYAVAGDYFYDFMTINAGVSISVVEAGRAGTTAVTNWTSITGKPTFAIVASSGSYADLSNKPANVSLFTNDSGYITSAGSVIWNNVTGKPTFANIATSGSYTDLTGKPTLVSLFTNDSGYITSAGNAATATKLATPRLINGVSFDGSTNITIPENMLASALTGTVLSANVVTSSLTSVGILSSLTVGGDAKLNSRVTMSAQLLIPTSGSTIQFDGSAVSVVNPGGTLATLTVIMPPTPTSNQILTVSFTDPVTSISMSAPSATVLSPLTTATTSTFAKWIYITPLASWVRIG